MFYLDGCGIFLSVDTVFKKIWFNFETTDWTTDWTILKKQQTSKHNNGVSNVENWIMGLVIIHRKELQFRKSGGS
jgi:hypothetical protein